MFANSHDNDSRGKGDVTGIDSTVPGEENGSNNSPSSSFSPGEGTELNDSSQAPDSDIMGLNERIQNLEAECASHKDSYLRALSEMENQKKRMERERADLLKYGIERLLKDIIPVLDSFDKACPSGGEEDKGKDIPDKGLESSFYIGVQLVKKQFLEVLRTHGLEAIDAIGKKFDPNYHQAIQRVDSEEHLEETVKDEFAKGYILNGRLLRPSMVSVFVPCEEKQS